MMQASWIQRRTIGRTFWGSSKFEDLGELSLTFGLTIFQARQLISHKKICVNYKIVNI